MKIRYALNEDTFWQFPIIGNLQLTKSSREVKFSDIEIDFSEGYMYSLPIKLQEVQILNDDDKVIYYGYVDSFKLPRFDKETMVVKLSITLISPLSILARKTNTLSGSYNIRELFDTLFAPLYEDGFVLTNFNVEDKTVNVNIVLQTIEYIVSYLSNRFNLWIYIDELKQITVNSIDYQFGKQEKLNLDTSNYKDLENIWYIEPTVSSVDYANVLNLKNARVYFDSRSFDNTIIGGTTLDSYNPLFNVIKTIKTGDTIDFAYPIDISENGIRKVIAEDPTETIYTKYAISLSGITTVTSTDKSMYIYISTSGAINDPNYNKYISTANISFDEDETATEFVLKRDGFFKNVITGFKYNGTENLQIYDINSNTVLIPSSLRLVNSNEIDVNKNKISKSGIIEKVIDVNQKWFTQTEAIDYARSLLSINSNQTDTVELAFKGNVIEDYSVGDKIKINITDLFTVGDFIVTDVKYSKDNFELESVILVLKNSNTLENYIDLFRRDFTEENEQQLNNILISPLFEETVAESHEVI